MTGKAKVKVKNEAVVGELHDHTHGPDGRTVKVIKVLNKMKTKAVTHSPHKKHCNRSLQPQ